MNAASWLESLPVQERWRALLLKEGPRLATWALALGLGVQGAFIVTDIASPGGRGAARHRRRSRTARTRPRPVSRWCLPEPLPVMILKTAWRSLDRPHKPQRSM